MNNLRTQLENYLKHLQNTEYYDEVQEMSVWVDTPFSKDFPNDCVRCTTGAMLIANKFGGQVFGYHIDSFGIDKDNENLVAYWCLGHDFCVVGNYLVDYWAKYVNDPNRKAIIDLNNPYDWGYLQKYYLPLDRWQPLQLWHK